MLSRKKIICRQLAVFLSLAVAFRRSMKKQQQHCFFSYSILVFLLTRISFSYGQPSQPFITEPRLISVIPVNSTALTVSWQFADESVDRSDLIRIYVSFYEYYYAFNQTYASNNYTFISTNKTITNLTRNFDLVNAYYYVCFSSNSSVSNTTRFLAIVNRCILTRTCLRSNQACPGPSSVIVTSTIVSSNSFQISLLWPIDLPFSPTAFSVQLINNGQLGTSISSTRNDSIINYSYQFSGLQVRTTYTVNTSFTYIPLFGVPITNITLLTVRTSSAWRWTSPWHLCSVIFFFQINRWTWSNG